MNKLVIEKLNNLLTIILKNITKPQKSQPFTNIVAYNIGFLPINKNGYISTEYLYSLSLYYNLNYEYSFVRSKKLIFLSLALNPDQNIDVRGRRHPMQMAPSKQW